MSKIILFSRVSSVKQDLVQQTNELVSEASRLGYNSDDQVKIEYKESAIKLSIDDRQGLQELKDYIDNDKEVSCVIVYEISRLSRQSTMLFQIRDYFIEKNIQLVCLKPYFRLLEDGKMSQTASILFSLFSSISESEMMIKKERMVRGKKHKQQAKGYIGGHIAYGYKVENDTIVVDEDKAKHVKLIFDMYEKGYSMRSIVEEIQSQGMFIDLNEDNARVKVRFILNNEGYTGENSKTYEYPAIISKEQFKRCREIAEDNKKPHSRTKMVYYLNGLLVNEINGRKLTPCIANKVYSSYKYEGRESCSINMDFIDSVILHLVDEKMKLIVCDEEFKKEMRQKMLILHRKRITATKKLNSLTDNLDRIEERYIEGYITKEKANKMVQKVNEEMKNLEKLITKYDYEIPEINEQIKNSTNGSIYDMDDEDKRINIHKIIHKIFIKKLPVWGEFSMKVFMNGDEENYEEYILVSRNKKCKWLIKDGEKIEYKLIKRLS